MRWMATQNPRRSGSIDRFRASGFTDCEVELLRRFMSYSFLLATLKFRGISEPQIPNSEA